jgi:hypothetical protein
MEKSEIEYSIQTALRKEFDDTHKFRAIEIYQTSKALGYDEQAEEMKNDILIDYNLKID